MITVTVSPCCNAPVNGSLGDGVLIGSCSKCDESVVRLNPKTGIQEWLDGHSPWTQTPLREVTAPA